MEYHLYPPFFVVPEEHCFTDAWEAFCCKILNLAEGRSDISRRTPPESGVDLYCPATKTAYQCKSVESGRAGDFDPGKALESLRAARKARDVLGWEKYVLCVNVDITGAAEARMRAEHRELDLRSRSYWIAACDRFPDAVTRNFRQILRIPAQRTEDALREEFSRHYGDDLLQLLRDEPVTLFLYSNRHDKVYQLTVSLEFRVLNLLRVLKRAFRLPGQVSYSLDHLTVSLSHTLVFNGRRLSHEKTLRESGLAGRDLITYWTSFEITDPEGELSSTVMHRAVPTKAGYEVHAGETGAVAARCDDLIREAFGDFDRRLAAGHEVQG